eukprot:1647976-Rhodomonas_salina.1
MESEWKGGWHTAKERRDNKQQQPSWHKLFFRKEEKRLRVFDFGGERGVTVSLLMLSSLRSMLLLSSADFRDGRGSDGLSGGDVLGACAYGVHMALRAYVSTCVGTGNCVVGAWA